MKTPIKRTVGIALAILALAVHTFASPGARTVTGRIASVEDDTVVIRTKPGATIEVKLAATTRYLKWVTTKPLQRDTRADRSHLKLGRLVAVEAEAGEAPMEARVVRIAVD